MRIAFSSLYRVDMAGHVFATEKFLGTAERLARLRVISSADLWEPPESSRENLLSVHTPRWIDSAVSGCLSPLEIARLEIPQSPEIVSAHLRAVSGTLEACRQAMRTGLGLHIGGGSHHAFPDHGEGFCMFNDLAVAARKMLDEKRPRSVMIVDLDVHQGNGTAFIFLGDPRVLTFSMHQQDLYPEKKETSTLDIGLKAGTRDERYLSILRESLPPLLESRHPGLVIYQAGADVYEKDRLGGLKLSIQGVQERDKIVYESCRNFKIPVAVTLGGGYAAELRDTVEIHCNTLRMAIRCLARPRP